MTTDWTTVYTTDRLYQAEFIRDTLTACGIEAVVLNQQDSSYLFGEIHVQVRHSDRIQAEEIIHSTHGE